MLLINTATVKLVRFDDESLLPPYAVLSHTWGDSEVSFEQFSILQNTLLESAKSRIQEGPGYEKIRLACRQAFTDKLDYLWVDTCCIDKRSSAELSEAINSMFRWYKKAKVCYAYLDDVEGGALFTAKSLTTDEFGIPQDLWNPTPEATVAEVSIETELGRARWFTRGWTLQELIAPFEVQFYGKEWAYLGTKSSLSKILASITGIDEKALRGGNLEAFSIAHRMSWAANRVTTRTEDLAYSLLGIFDVNIPLLYGEGEKAFIRLQEEIMKDSSDESLFAWTPTPKSTTVEPMDPHRWRPVFASHPREFASCMLAPLHQGSDDYALTNQGVKISIPVLPFERRFWNSDWLSDDMTCFHTILHQQSLFLVILNCYFTSGRSLNHRVAIVCQRISRGYQLVRHDTADVVPINEHEYKQARRLDVYLLKKMPASVRTFNRRDSVSLQTALHDLEYALDNLSSPPPLFSEPKRKLTNDFLLAPRRATNRNENELSVFKNSDSEEENGT